MEKMYTLKAIRPLIPMAREAFHLRASFDPFGDGTEQWIVRYIVDAQGFWLQVNDKYGEMGMLSHREILGMTGMDTDDLEETPLENVGCRWGLPGGLPILPLPFTAKQFREFCARDGGVLSSAMDRGSFPAPPALSPDDVRKEFDKGPPCEDSLAWCPSGRNFNEEWWSVLKESNPDAVELARFILLGVEPPADTAPAQTTTPAPVVAGKKWTPEKLAELKAYREAHTMPETADKFGISEQRIRELLPSQKPKAKPLAGLIHRMK